MNNTGLLDWMILDSANVYKGFENIEYARLKKMQIISSPLCFIENTMAECSSN